MSMSTAVLEKMKSVEGKESIAMEQFAKALQQIPAIMADNAGFDSPEIVGKLRASHAQGKHDTGIDFAKAEVGDMAKLGIMESYRSKMLQLCAAAEAAEQIIRVDEIIRNAPRQREG